MHGKNRKVRLVIIISGFMSYVSYFTYFLTQTNKQTNTQTNMLAHSYTNTHIYPMRIFLHVYLYEFICVCVYVCCTNECRSICSAVSHLQRHVLLLQTTTRESKGATSAIPHHFLFSENSVSPITTHSNHSKSLKSTCEPSPLKWA